MDRHEHMNIINIIITNDEEDNKRLSEAYHGKNHAGLPNGKKSYILIQEKKCFNFVNKSFNS